MQRGFLSALCSGLQTPKLELYSRQLKPLRRLELQL